MKKILVLNICLLLFVASQAKFISVPHDDSYKGKVKKVTIRYIDFDRDPLLLDSLITIQFFGDSQLLEIIHEKNNKVTDRVKYIYNDHGQLIKEVDVLKDKVNESYAYNSDGLLSEEYRFSYNDDTFLVIRNKYDSKGNKTESCCDNGGGSPWCIYYSYNAKGQNTSLRNPKLWDDKVIHYKYDAAGNVIEATEESGKYKSHKTIYKYSNSGATIETEDYIDGKLGLTAKEINSDLDNEGNFLKTTYYYDGKLSRIRIRTIEYQ
jgi:YD repeat-containing protein